MGLSARSLRRTLPAAVGVALLAAGSGPRAAPAQQPLRAPSGRALDVPRDTLLRMLEETRAYRDTLVQDPDVLYYTGFSPSAALDDTARALPWNSVEVRSDSVARVATPGGLREGDRAYQAYAVARMESYRRPDPGAERSCAERVATEVRVLRAFARGWIVARVYYGAPAYPALDEIAFLHRRGMLAPFLATREPPQLEGCARRWAEENPRAMDAYRRWREEEFVGGGGAPPPDAPADEERSAAGAPRAHAPAGAN